jgi:hypothetical protein
MYNTCSTVLKDFGSTTTAAAYWCGTVWSGELDSLRARIWGAPRWGCLTRDTLLMCLVMFSAAG